MLVSAVNQDVLTLADKMNIESDAIIVNQGEEFAYNEYTKGECRIQCYSLREKGVGLSRNTALMRASSEFCVFADEDIVYQPGYAAEIVAEFEKNRQADILLFNVKVAPARRTYWNMQDKRVRWYNCGRYPAYSIAARTEVLHRTNLSFSLLFGGGARYSNGEDSLFLRDCLQKRLRVYASSVVIGEEKERESTWFHGYNRIFFKDRGVLYHYLYGIMAIPFSLRFLLAHKQEMCREITAGQAFAWMREGIAEAQKR